MKREMPDERALDTIAANLAHRGLQPDSELLDAVTDVVGWTGRAIPDLSEAERAAITRAAELEASDG